MSNKNSLASAYVALNRRNRELEGKIAALKIDVEYLTIQNRLAEDEVKLLRGKLEDLRKAALDD